MKIVVFALLVVGASAMLPSCSATSVQDTPGPKAQRELADALAGLTPGPPVHCISHNQSSGMRAIDDNTLLFRDGRTTYLQRPRGACLGLGNRTRTLVTSQYGTSNLCDGDINHTVDLVSKIPGNACIFGPFVPYTKP
jgi:hypothetical protein